MRHETVKIMGCFKKTKTDGLPTDTRTQSIMGKYQKECLCVTNVTTHRVLIPSIFGLGIIRQT